MSRRNLASHQTAGAASLPLTEFEPNAEMPVVITEAIAVGFDKSID